MITTMTIFDKYDTALQKRGVDQAYPTWGLETNMET